MNCSQKGCSGWPIMADRQTRGTLTARLRQGTRNLHSKVERAGVMSDLVQGRLERSRYCLMLRNLHEIYVALEEALAPVAEGFPLEQLRRSAALQNDLEFLHGPAWRQQLPVVPSTSRYVQHLKALRAERPTMLIAHGYLRHLGDLSGGQLLRERVRLMLGLNGKAGSSFYEFPAGTAADLAKRYRGQLDAMDLSDLAIDELVEEARVGFALHGEMFCELALQPLPAGSPSAPDTLCL